MQINQSHFYAINLHEINKVILEIHICMFVRTYLHTWLGFGANFSSSQVYQSETKNVWTLRIMHHAYLYKSYTKF